MRFKSKVVFIVTAMMNEFLLHATFYQVLNLLLGFED
jgi:hypothetical protein